MRIRPINTSLSMILALVLIFATVQVCAAAAPPIEVAYGEATGAASEAPIEETKEDTLAAEPAQDSQAGLETLLVGGLAMALGAGFGIYFRRRRDKKDSKH